MSTDNGGDEERQADREPSPKTDTPKNKAGRGQLILGIGVGVFLMLLVNGAIQQFRDRDGGRPAEASGDADSREASAAGGGKGFALPGILGKAIGNDGKTCVRVWEGNDTGFGDAFVAELKERQPDWDISTSEVDAPCTADFFVSLWGSPTETTDREWGGLWQRDTLITYVGYVGVAAINAPGLSASPTVLIDSSSAQDDVIEALTRDFAADVRKRGTGRQGRYAFRKPAEDEQICVAVTVPEGGSVNYVAEDIQVPIQDIWVQGYQTNEHNTQNCPTDFYLTYATGSAKAGGDRNMGHTAVFAFKGEGNWPVIASAHTRSQDRSRITAFQYANRFLKEERFKNDRGDFGEVNP